MRRRICEFRPSSGREVAAVLAMALVALSGCGSDGDDSLTVEAFRDQANAICADGAAEIGAAVGAVFGGGEATPDVMEQALVTIVDVTRRNLDDIDALRAPETIDDDVDAMIAEGRSATTVAEAQGLAFWDDDGDPWATTNAMASELGLDVCASN